jgi:hypothetical protein
MKYDFVQIVQSSYFLPMTILKPDQYLVIVIERHYMNWFDLTWSNLIYIMIKKDLELNLS